MQDPKTMELNKRRLQKKELLNINKLLVSKIK